MEPSLFGVTLRQVAHDDMPFLFRLLTDPSRCHLWMRFRRVFDEREFEEAWAAWTSEEIASKFLVESETKAIGIVYEYDRSLEDGITKITALLDRRSEGLGRGRIAIALMMDWLFENLPLRKVYMETYGYNPTALLKLRKVGFAEEAVLQEHRYRDGSYWDLHIFAATREDWLRARPLLLRRGKESARQAADAERDAATPFTESAKANEALAPVGAT